MPIRTLAAAFLLATGFAGVAAADLIVTGSDVNIFSGTVELYSAGGQLLSTTTALTVESDLGIDYYSTLDPAFPLYVPLMAQSIVQQIQSNVPGYNIPSRFSNNLQTFEDSNGLGIFGPGSTFNYPNFLTTPASQQLFGILTTQSVPFVITSDTGDVELTSDVGDITNPADPPPPGKLGVIQYFWGPFGPFPTDPNNTAEGVVAVHLIDRDIHLQEVTATPEPNPRAALGLLCAGLALYGWRRQRTSYPAKAAPQCPQFRQDSSAGRLHCAQTRPTAAPQLGQYARPALCSAPQDGHGRVIGSRSKKYKRMPIPYGTNIASKVQTT